MYSKKLGAQKVVTLCRPWSFLGSLGPAQEDNTWGTTEADFTIGEKVAVKALKDGDNYTLQRCMECYIKRITPRQP